MAHLSVRLKIIVAIGASVAVVYLAVLNLHSRVRWREISDGVVWTSAPEGVVARLVEPEGPAAKAGIERGDRLLGLNGRPIRDLDDYYRTLDRLAAPSEAVYLIRKAEAERKISYVVNLRLQSLLGRTDVYRALLAFVYLSIGILIFFRNWRGQFAFHFFLVCLLSFVLYLFRYTGTADAFDIFTYWMSSTALLLLPAVFFHFCLNFPIVSTRLPRRLFLFAAYGSGVSLLATHALWFAGVFNVIGIPRNPPFSRFFDRIHLIYFIGWFAAAAGVLIHSRLRSRSVEQRQQLKWIERGTVLAILPFALLYGVPYLMGIVPGPWLESSILSLALMPMGFAYAIVKYRLMDVDIIFKQGAAYFVASTALLAVYFALVLFAGKLVLLYAPDAGFIFFALAALMVAFLFAPMRKRIQGSIDRFFYQEQYDYRSSFAEFSKTLSSEISLDRLAARLLERLQKTLSVDQTALFMRQEGDWYLMRYALNVPAERNVFNLQEELFGACDVELKPLYLTFRDETVRPVRSALQQMGLYYVQPLRVRDRVIAFLSTGKRRDGELLSSEDLELLQTISGYAAIAIENASLYQRVETKARELEQLKIFSESIIESIRVGVLTVDAAGVITSVNTAVEGLLGYSRRDCLGKAISSILPGGVLDQVRAAAGEGWVLSEPLNFYKVAVSASDGQKRLVNLHFAPFVSRDDVVAGTLVVMDDVTQKVRLEDQLVQAEKLTSLGLLAAGVAHEVNTPLAGISSYTQMLLKDVPRDHPHYEILAKVEKQSFRASEIVNNLLNFARLSGSDFQELNLNHLMLETLSLLDHQFKNQGIDVAANLDPTLPETYGNGGKLQQVFMNLLMNAKDAMPEGGRIEIRTAREENGISVRIRDTGTGIARDHIKKIYDPFFTTKEVGSGTGLGLSISYGIIQEHSGNIRVESEPGKGTEFTLQFPVRRIH
ncbi:MAG TPA: ATP-binding protein [Acidobacteriota bacterium]